MGLKKYKYYFRKPKSEIVKDVLQILFTTGAVAVASTSPYFLTNLWKSLKKVKRYPKKKFRNIFYYLKSRGFLEVRRENNQIYISLTDEGKKRAGRFQIDSLRVVRPRRWDGKWRLVIFDISELKKVRREAFRGKLKQLGFYQLQKSVWAHPFDCKPEVDLLREFFGLSEEELRLVVADNVGNTHKLRKMFNL